MLGFDDNFKKNVIRGFQAVKVDINELEVRLNPLLSMLDQIQIRLENLEKTLENRKISESQASLNLRLRQNESGGKPLKPGPTKVLDSLNTSETETKTGNLSEKASVKKSQDKLKEDLLKSYKRNRKEIVKQQIVIEAGKKLVTKSDLREVIVDEKNYCSKASFYRYLEELVDEGLVKYKVRSKRVYIQPVIESTKPVEHRSNDNY